MFRWLLRQLNILPKHGNSFRIRIQYKCETCNRYVEVLLTNEEWSDLFYGIPFDATFTKDRKAELTYFKKRLCQSCFQKGSDDV